MLHLIVFLSKTALLRLYCLLAVVSVSFDVGQERSYYSYQRQQGTYFKYKADAGDISKPSEES